MFDQFIAIITKDLKLKKKTTTTTRSPEYDFIFFIVFITS